MALNALKCNCLTPLHSKGLTHEHWSHIAYFCISLFLLKCWSNRCLFYKASRRSREAGASAKGWGWSEPPHPTVGKCW